MKGQEKGVPPSQIQGVDASKFLGRVEFHYGGIENGKIKSFFTVPKRAVEKAGLDVAAWEAAVQSRILAKATMPKGEVYKIPSSIEVAGFDIPTTIVAQLEASSGLPHEVARKKAHQFDILKQKNKEAQSRNRQ